MATATSPSSMRLTQDPKTGAWVPQKQRTPLAVTAIGWVVKTAARFVWGVVTLVMLAFAWTVKRGVRAAAWTVRAATVGPHRTAWLPAWVAVVAVASAITPGPWATAGWLTAAVLIGVLPAIPTSRRWLSDREAALVARVFAGVTLWVDLAAHSRAPYSARLALLTVVVLAGAIPWWWGRRTRPVVEPKFPQLWRDVVVHALPRTAGEFIEWDPETGSGILELESAKASEVARLDEDVEATLARDAGLPMRRGMVTIADDPRLLVHQVRIVLARSPEDVANASRYWEGPTLGDPDSHGRHRKPGMYLLAVTKTGQEVWVKHRDVKNGRARFFSWDGPTGTGKGGSMRIAIVESALDPDTLTLIADGKWGAGLGYCRAGAASYADNPDAVGEQADRVIAVLRARAARYGREGRDSFTPRPGDPQIDWFIDELPRILASKVGRKVATALNEIGAIGGSLGVVAKVAKQRGDAGSWGFGVEATTTRTNFSGGGGRWVGPSDDTQGHRSNQQGNTDLDASKLPRNGGWAFIVDGAPKPPPSRGVWLPNRRDVSEKGAENRYGTAEDWFESGTVHPELEDESHSILLANPLPGVDGASTAAAADEPVRESITVTKDDTPTTRDTVLASLPADGGVTRNDLRCLLELNGVKITNRQVSNVLADLRDKGLAVSENSLWRKAS